MLKLSIAAGSVGLMALALPLQAQAQYGGYPYNDPGIRNVQCERQRSDDSATGTIVGALAGALIGGAIGNEIADDDDRGSYRSYGRGRGRSYYGGHRGRDDNDGEVIAGALIGAFIGGAAGNSIAGDTGPDCQVAYAPQRYSSVPQGSIPRSTQGLYGGPEVMSSQSRYPAAYPSAPSYPAAPDYRDEPRYSEPDRDCRVIQRETRLPDGEVQRDPVTACWNDRTRQWQIQDGYSDEPYGY
ncbi:glycine zipper domain-containing protein [Hyphomonas sp.]|uniref:glycine zipper domain-containing protein n=1 Tax=Hyphomonas sp. TaxID=87 RepID=UPI001D227F3C|nr:glycine zipper domain-containing protein [Hyphomonas sp.]MBU3919186.1 glycine zipper 2TM domain-containing protein [Alphaproteobacteria bacterium]MBU4062243.1 glycine zipper 2TM domain-containing protein [Alphaproteobacteria bacterium]MBU4165678.1 glycine zipper 2TM domain-containing protein [Alphaproteobacteria bacterium]